MKKILLIPLLLVSNLGYSQTYDFDSLYENSREFKTVIDSILPDYDLFEDNEPLKVTLTSDFKNLRKRKYKDEYQPAVLRMNFNDTVETSRDVKIKARGVMRLKKCYYPPITINFKKGDVYIGHLKNFDKLKLVQLCEKGEAYEQYVMLEYYIYKLYNIISPYSLRVRLLEVSYIDTSGKQNPRTNYAFLIEDINQLAKRMNSVEIKMDHLNSRQIDEEWGDIMYIFQYLIGNTDFSVTGRHNFKLIKINDIHRPKPIAIPYDFDYAGMVNAYYAVPTEGLPIKSVRERFYRGNCRPEEEFAKAVSVFIDNKKGIYDLIKSAAFLEDKNKEKTIRYIDEFYELIDENDVAVRYFSRNCRQK